MNTLKIESELQLTQGIERLEQWDNVNDRISVMIRTFNRPIELKRAIASVVMQSQKNLELIIVNDGNKLAEDTVVEACERDDITWKIIDTNGLGRSFAANAAIRAASGAYGLFLDDDDSIEPEHLEKLFLALRQTNPKCVASYTGTRWVKSDDDFECQDKEIMVFELLIRNKLPIHSVLFDLSIVRVNQIYFDESILVYEDWDFWLQLGAVGDFAYVEGCSAVYNIGNGSGVHALPSSELRDKVNLIREKWLNKIPRHWFFQFLDAYEEKGGVINILNNDASEKSGKIIELNKKISEYEMSKKEVELDRAVLEITLKQVQEFELIQAELKIALAQLSDSRNSLKIMKLALDQVYLSKSWRLTSPLRYISRVGKNCVNSCRSWFGRKLRQLKKLINFNWRFLKNIFNVGLVEAISEAKKESAWLNLTSKISVVKKYKKPSLVSCDPFDLVVRYSAEPVKDYRFETIAIGAAGQGNLFMKEIGSLIGSALVELGHSVEFFDEKAIDKALGSDLIVLVAPHEFFLLCGESNGIVSRLLEHPNLVLVNTEQPQTQWFASALNYLKQARAVWDMSFNVAVLLRSNGINAYHLPLGFCQTYQNNLLSEQKLARTAPLLSLSEQVTGCRPSSYCDRPIDILFVGTISEKRSQFFAKNAKIFSRYNCYFYLPNGDQPFLDGADQAIGFKQLVGLATRSKIVLNIHRDDETYFEWQRIVNIGVFSKALVISETCDSNPFIKPNLHYIDAPLELISDFCIDFLQDTVKAEKFTQRAYDRLSVELILKDKLVKILGVIE